jgi:excisionase family DNA binding protein
MPQKTSKSLELLSIRAASRLLKIDHRTLKRAILAGDCPAVQLGKRYKIERRALERWTSVREPKQVHVIHIPGELRFEPSAGVRITTSKPEDAHATV